MSVSTTVRVGGLELATPVILASGCVGYGDEWGDLIDREAVGAVVLKGVSREPWVGNDGPRLAEVPAGVVNAVGLENVGLERFIKEKLPALESFPAAVVANVVGKTAREYVEVCAALDEQPRVNALELNVSCPNVKTGGMTFAANAEALRRLIRDCRDVTTKPLWVKLPPMVTDFAATAKAALAGGADALTVANTYPAMVVDVAARRPVLGNVYGGLSGPAIRAITLRLVRIAYEGTPQGSRANIIASGGIDGWEAAAAYMLAGARAVAIGTALFTNPRAPREILDGLVNYASANGFTSLEELCGALAV